MPLNVGQHVLHIVVVGLAQVVDNLGNAELFQRLLREIVLVDISVENRGEKLDVDAMRAASVGHSGVAHSQRYPKAVEHCDSGSIVKNYLAEFRVAVD